VGGAYHIWTLIRLPFTPLVCGGAFNRRRLLRPRVWPRHGLRQTRPIARCALAQGKAQLAGLLLAPRNPCGVPLSPTNRSGWPSRTFALCSKTVPKDNCQRGRGMRGLRLHFKLAAR
jgi:hypothetical protein